jgi:pimeloyl-ACP methyl ester carboxylesterase
MGSESRSSAVGGDAITERTVDLRSGVRVRVLDEGQGPPLLLLHGNPDNADEWSGLIRRLRSDFRCVAPDLPGYGPLGKTYELPRSYRYTRDEQVTFVDEVLEAVGVEGPLTLVVHDIGGIMGVPWAAKNTRRLRAVVYTNTVAFPRFGWFPLARMFGARGPLGRRVASANVNLIGWFGGALFRRAFSRQNPELSAAEIDRFVRDFGCNDVAKQTTLRQFQEVTRIEFFDGYDAMLEAIRAAVPTLTLWGEGDPYVPTRFAEQLLAQKTTLLPGVGHWVPIVASERLAGELRTIAR